MTFHKGQKVKCKFEGSLVDGIVQHADEKEVFIILPVLGAVKYNPLDVYPSQPDDIRQQSHYTQFKIQPVVFIAENNLDFLTGNIIKYVLRHNKKNGIQDLEKAKHYLDMLIQKVSGQEVKP